MKTSLIVIAMGVLAYLLLWREATPLRHRNLTPDRLLKLVQALYFRGYDGGELYLHSRGSAAPRLRLVKHIIAENDVNLTGDIEVPDGSPLVGRLIDELSRVGLHFDQAMRSDDDQRVFSMRFGNDLAGACSVGRALFRAMELDVERDGVLYVRRASERSARIGWSS